MQSNRNQAGDQIRTKTRTRKRKCPLHWTPKSIQASLDAANRLQRAAAPDQVPLFRRFSRPQRGRGNWRWRRRNQPPQRWQWTSRTQRQRTRAAPATATTMKMLSAMPARELLSQFVAQGNAITKATHSSTRCHLHRSRRLQSGRNGSGTPPVRLLVGEVHQ